jgi:glyoxylase-like metal-dependent hydrolase (beta-lactamase superfamily II)/rhodanese-related sulfurtransferase
VTESVAGASLLERTSGVRLYSFDHPSLGDRSYLLIDEPSGTAAVIDPQRELQPYLDAASRHRSRITYALETHLHNDFVSGARRLAVEHRATVVASNAADLSFPHRGVAGGDTIELGSIRIKVLATPGHTHEHVSYLVPGDNPLLFSGGALLPGGAARIDLFGADESKVLAGLAHRTIGELLALDARARVLATHAGGSFCSTGAHGDPTTTIEQERHHNRFAGLPDATAFLDAATRDVPPVPTYYPRVRARNRQGELRAPTPARELQPVGLAELMRHGPLTVIDTRAAAEYAQGHIRDSLAIGLDGAFAPWAGWLVDESALLALVVADARSGHEATTALGAVGLDDVAGYVVGIGSERVHPVSVRRLSAGDLRRRDQLVVVDTRWEHEWRAGHIPGALHASPDVIAREGLPALFGERRAVAVHCAGDYRSAISVSLLERAGVLDLIHVADGLAGWQAADGPVEESR